MPPRIRVLKGKSPSWVKLNAPATGHRIGTGSFPIKQNTLKCWTYHYCTRHGIRFNA